MRNAMLVVAVVAVAILLVGCGPSKCEQAGGKLKFSHYDYTAVAVPTGSGGVTMHMQPIPNYECEMPR